MPRSLFGQGECVCISCIRDTLGMVRENGVPDRLDQGELFRIMTEYFVIGSCQAHHLDRENVFVSVAWPGIHNPTDGCRQW
jgi:hypothetical protein